MAAGGSAYLRLQGPDNGISQGMQYWGGIAAQRGAEERARKEREGIRKDQEIKDWEAKWNLKEADFQNQYTGFNNYDDVAADFSMHAIDKYIEYQRAANEAIERGDVNARRKFEQKMMKVKNSFKEFAKGQEAYAALNAEYMKKAQEGSISGVDAGSWEAAMEAIALKYNYAVRLDDQDNLVYTGIADFPDGSRKTFTVANADLINGNFSPYDRQQITGDKGIVDEILHTLGKREVSSVSGFSTFTSQKFGPQQQASARAQIQTLMTGDAFVADILNQKNGSVKRTGFTDAEVKEAEDFIYDMVKAGYDTKYAEKRDFGAARDAQKDLGGLATIELKTETKSGKPLDVSGPKEEGQDQIMYSFTLGNTVNLGVGDRSKMINSINMDDQGNISFSGLEPNPDRGSSSSSGIKRPGEMFKSSPSEPNYIPFTSFSEDEVNNFSRRILNPDTNQAFKNATELRQHLESKVGFTSAPLLDDMVVN